MAKRGNSQSQNDQRSNSMNPNNAAYQASTDNRSDQLNPNNDEYQGNEKKKQISSPFFFSLSDYYEISLRKPFWKAKHHYHSRKENDKDPLQRNILGL